MKETAVPLSNETKVKGIGKAVTVKILKRKGQIALSERSDGVYEVFFIKVQDANEMFGRFYPKRELYPSNEDFGKTAWCYTNYNSALIKYNSL